MKKLNNITVKVGTTEEFFARTRKTMRALDAGKPIESSHLITFEEPSELLQFLSENRLKVIKEIKAHPNSITNIAKSIHRTRESVSKDIKEMAKFGLVKIINAVNPGHGRCKIVELMYPSITLQAII